MVLRGSKTRPEGDLLTLKKEIQEAESGLVHEIEEAHKGADLKQLSEIILQSEEAKHSPQLAAAIRTLVHRVDTLESLVEKKQKAQGQISKTLKQLACGGLAGATARTFVAPIDRVKIIMQTSFLLQGEQNPGSIASVARKILQEEGVKKFWRGNGVNCVRVFPYAATQFVSYEKYKELVLKTFDSDSFGMKERLISGSMAGATAATLTHPLDVMRVRLATQKELTGWADCIKSIKAEAGIKGFYKGYVPTVCSLAPFISINFSTFDYLKTNYGPTDESKFAPLQILALGGAAGLCAQTICYPLDTIRRRMQIKGTHYTSLPNAVTTILKNEGPRGFYKGIAPNAIKVVPNNGIRFLAYTYLTKWMGVESKYDKKVKNALKQAKKKLQ